MITVMVTARSSPPRPAGKCAHDGAQIVEGAGEPVHRVHDHDVAVADTAEQRIKLRSDNAFPGGLVGKPPVELDALELTNCALVEAADSVPALSDADRLQPESARLESRSVTTRYQSIPTSALSGRLCVR